MAIPTEMNTAPVAPGPAHHVRGGAARLSKSAGAGRSGRRPLTPSRGNYSQNPSTSPRGTRESIANFRRHERGGMRTAIRKEHRHQGRGEGEQQAAVGRSRGGGDRLSKSGRLHKQKPAKTSAQNGRDLEDHEHVLRHARRARRHS